MYAKCQTFTTKNRVKPCLKACISYQTKCPLYIYNFYRVQKVTYPTLTCQLVRRWLDTRLDSVDWMSCVRTHAMPSSTQVTLEVSSKQLQDFLGGGWLIQHNKGAGYLRTFVNNCQQFPKPVDNISQGQGFTGLHEWHSINTP